MVVTEQNVHFVSERGNCVYVPENGTLDYQGPMPEFLGNEHVRKAHLAV